MNGYKFFLSFHASENLAPGVVYPLILLKSLIFLPHIFVLARYRAGVSGAWDCATQEEVEADLLDLPA